MRLAHTAFACVCTTALGLLVVPDVNMIPNGASARSARPAHEAASPRRSSNGMVAPADVGRRLADRSSITAIHLSSAPPHATVGELRAG